MKKLIINIYLVIILSILLLGCVNTQTHNYIDGICTCGETLIHIHQFINEKCECGAKGPHTHSYNNGICMCGEYDTNYIKNHNHVYKEGVCSCSEKEINHSHEYKYGICECGEYQNHKHIYLYDNYRVCYCGYVDKHIHNYIEGKCSCGIKEGKDDINIIEFLSNDYEVKYIKEALKLEYYEGIRVEYNLQRLIYKNTFTEWLFEKINVKSIALDSLNEETITKIRDLYTVDSFSSLNVFLDQVVVFDVFGGYISEVRILYNGYIIWYNPYDQQNYISIDKIDYYEIIKQLELYQWRNKVV